MDYDKTKCLYETAKNFEWDKWCSEIPFLEFPKGWMVKAIPPFGVGIIRYHIKHKAIPDSFVSVYLDCYDQAGYVGKPYWEIYPNSDGDCDRFLIAETADLIKGIASAFKHQKKETERRGKE